MLLEDLSEKKNEPDNIDRCVRTAKELSERKGKYITYGIYMGLYHDKEKKPRTKK